MSRLVCLRSTWQTVFIRDLNAGFVLSTVLGESKISESLSLSFHRLADLSNDMLYVLSQIICSFADFGDLISGLCLFVFGILQNWRESLTSFSL